ncbi:hypothetical protein GE09DRAFT_1284184 [Coniochaeta sp. 2T2.1]|nr:hypothetical protein GE09DRAFT_1284184 [Coniochaeta sp. 2T2.1]
MPAINLFQVLPKSGFDYPRAAETIITSKQQYDLQIQRAMRSSGGTTRFSRPEVCKLLLVVFEIATVTVQAVYLVLGIRAARRTSLKKHGEDRADAGSWAARLGAAVDGFDGALDRMGGARPRRLGLWRGVVARRRRRSFGRRGGKRGLRLRSGRRLCVTGWRGWGSGVVGGEVWEDNGVEIVTEREADVEGDVEMTGADGNHLYRDAVKGEESSLEPYFGSDA